MHLTKPLSFTNIKLFYFILFSFCLFVFFFSVVIFPVVLKDVSHTVMSELLQFMYQGVVNVKHAELSSFMKIAQTLQIKGLAMSSNSQQQHNSHKSPSSPVQRDNNPIDVARNMTANAMENYPLNIFDNKIQSALLNSFHSATPALASLKRSTELGNGSSSADAAPSFLKKRKRLSTDTQENDASAESMDENDEVFMPQVSMETPRFDLANVKREANDLISSPAAIRNFLPPHFNFEYNGSFNKNNEYLNEAHNNNDLDKLTSGNNSGNGNHMDIPAGKTYLFRNHIYIHNQILIAVESFTCSYYS